MKVDSKVQEAFELATKARLNAFADHSKVKVGAALKLKGHDQIYAGCNVEYIVNGLSTCAERNAVATAFAAVGRFEIEFVVVNSNTQPALYPCGVCLQTMSELAGADLDIYISNKEGIIAKTTLGELLTHQYSELPKVLED